jgi:hypothetical protein
MQTPLLFRHTEASAPAKAPEKRGAVYTKPWVTELILDMAGYDVKGDLATKFAVEPAAGEGAFLAPMAVRLIRSALSKGREPLECQGSLLAYELDQESADVARTSFAQQNGSEPKVVLVHAMPSPISCADFLLLGKAVCPMFAKSSASPRRSPDRRLMARACS